MKKKERMIRRKSLPFTFLENIVWYGAFILLMIAFVETMLIYRLPTTFLEGGWFYLAVLAALCAILYFLKQFSDYQQWTLFK